MEMATDGERYGEGASVNEATPPDPVYSLMTPGRAKEHMLGTQRPERTGERSSGYDSSMTSAEFAEGC